MDLDRKYLIACVLGALNTANVLRPVRTGPVSLPSFASGTVTVELPLHTIGLQALATAEFARRGAWGTREGRLGLALSAASWAALAYMYREARRTDVVLAEALDTALGPQRPRREWPRATLRQTALPTMGQARSLRRARNIAYGPAGKRNRLDVWRSPDAPAGEKAPVLLQVHGGGWITAQKEGQAEPLMTHMVNAGWVCVTINYRLSPNATWPDHIVDVKRAIAWVRENVADYGGDPDFIAITGGSAGGHLAALAALTANDPELQPGFEDVDTTLRAAVPFYGVYDFTNRDGTSRDDMLMVTEPMVFKQKLADNFELFDRASPSGRVHADSPPFFVLHGTNDSLIPVEQARSFVARLRAVSQNPVAYAELPWAQHAFEIFTSVRTIHTVRAVQVFLDSVRADAARQDTSLAAGANR